MANRLAARAVILGTFTSMSGVGRRGRSTLSSKNRLTVPVEAMAAAGLKPGDRLVARADGPGRVVFEREADPVDEFAGVLTGVYGKDSVEKLRSEWD